MSFSSLENWSKEKPCVVLASIGLEYYICFLKFCFLFGVGDRIGKGNERARNKLKTVLVNPRSTLDRTMVYIVCTYLFDS